MDGQTNPETIQLTRTLVLLRLGLLAPAVVFVLRSPCAPSLTVLLTLLLVVMGLGPTLGYLFRGGVLGTPAVHGIVALFDFAVAAALNTLAVLVFERDPLFFPLFLLVALEATVWWGWPGALVSGAASSVTVALLYTAVQNYQSSFGLILIALMMGWPIVLGYFIQLGMQQWSERRKIAGQLADREDRLRRAREQIQGWQDTCVTLCGAGSSHLLLERALREAMSHTRSCVGWVTLREPSGENRLECWQGFVPHRPQFPPVGVPAVLPAPDGGLVQLRYYVEIPLRRMMLSSAAKTALPLGQLVVARQRDHPYDEGEMEWLHLLANYTTVLLENCLLEDQLGRIHQETDGVLTAGWTLASLPDPAAGLEMACRKIAETLGLLQVEILLYGSGEGRECQRITYPLEGPTEMVTTALPGRGVSLLRRYLQSGAPLIINHRVEYSEVFELMGWSSEVQAVACFPLYVQYHRWGALCMLARSAGVFPPQTQQNLTIFSGEVAMALENYHLRQVLLTEGQESGSWVREELQS